MEVDMFEHFYKSLKFENNFEKRYLQITSDFSANYKLLAENLKNLQKLHFPILSVNNAISKNNFFRFFCLTLTEP